MDDTADNSNGVSTWQILEQLPGALWDEVQQIPSAIGQAAQAGEQAIGTAIGTATAGAAQGAATGFAQGFFGSLNIVGWLALLGCGVAIFYGFKSGLIQRATKDALKAGESLL